MEQIETPEAEPEAEQLSKEELRKKISSLTPQDYADSRKRVLSERAQKGAATRAQNKAKADA